MTKSYLHIAIILIRYWYDTSLKSWTVTRINKYGHQIGTADYYQNKKALLKGYPTLEFMEEKDYPFEIYVKPKYKPIQIWTR